MKVVLQRVKSASVSVKGTKISCISNGLMILLGVTKTDTEDDVKLLTDKIVKFRIFSDENNKMNLSVKDISGSILVVSQFTLCGGWQKGRRPSFSSSAPPKLAKKLYLLFISLLKNYDVHVKTGEFGAMMDVALINDGPVTFVMDSRDKI